MHQNEYGRCSLKEGRTHELTPVLEILELQSQGRGGAEGRKASREVLLQ